MTIVDGKALAAELIDSLHGEVVILGKSPTLTIITCAPNFETQKYLDLKKRIATRIGINIKTVVLPESATTTDCVAAIEVAVKETDGVVVQLPLPKQIDTDKVLSAIPASHDVDAFFYTAETKQILPPVVGAIDVISYAHEVKWEGKKVVVLGAGRLVGEPAAMYAKAQGAEVTVITKDSDKDLVSTAVSQAEIIILGTGEAGILKPEMVTPGIVVFDAGTSEDGGVLVGDADPAVANVASLFTPVPGGIGPLTIAVLFRNLLDLATRQ